MPDKKPDPLTMLYRKEFKDGPFVIKHGEAFEMHWVMTEDVAAAKKAGYKPFAELSKKKG